MQSLNKSNPKIWDSHYAKEKSKLVFPDENLVRILSRIPTTGAALDHGAGSGRHTILLKSYGFQVSACDYSSKSMDSIKAKLFPIQTLGPPPKGI